MPELFERCFIGGMEIRNRFVRSATWEGMADNDGRTSAKLNGLLGDLARNEVGLIISGHAYVREEGRAAPGQLSACSDALIPSLATMTKEVHDADGRIALQLAHAGCQAACQKEGIEVLGPSPLQTEKGAMGRAMTTDEIQAVIRSFGEAAARARQAGFDAVQIHSAHGYLLSQFLSPYYNKRSDSYGGGLQNRARIVLEVFHRVRQAVGPEFPILIKMNCEDFLEGGFTVDEMLQVSELLRHAGIDAIEMSGGSIHSGSRSPVRRTKAESEDEEPYYREAAARFKSAVGVPLILVGGVRSHGTAERLVKTGAADFIALSRPLIREPHLIRRWKEGDRNKAACVSDNLCFGPAMKGIGIYCVTDERLRRRSTGA